jgi:hypothetical protein
MAFRQSICCRGEVFVEISIDLGVALQQQLCRPVRRLPVEKELQPPVSWKLSAALLFLYYSGGRDRTMIWDIHWNEERLC